MFCKYCHTYMRSVMRFEPNKKSYKLYRCPKCNYESKPIPLILPRQDAISNTKKTNKKKNRNKKKRAQNDNKR